jgi:hypothetical protein
MGTMVSYAGDKTDGREDEQSPATPLIIIGGMEVYLHVFLTSALDGSEWSASRPDPFTPGVRAPGRYPLHRMLGGPYSRPGPCGEENTSLLLPAIEPRSSKL